MRYLVNNKVIILLLKMYKILTICFSYKCISVKTCKSSYLHKFIKMLTFLYYYILKEK